MSGVPSKEILGVNLSNCLRQLEEGESFTSVLDMLSDRAIQSFPDATTGSLSNCRGRWFEILLIYSLNLAIQDMDARCFVKLGTASEHTLFQIFNNVGNKINIPPNYTLNLSMPDMLFIRNVPKVLNEWKKKILSFESNSVNSESVIDDILGSYKHLMKDPIPFEDCIAFCSIKTSLRPDRKYQAMYEAECIRAIEKRISGSNEAKYVMVGPVDAKKTKSILETNYSIVSLADQNSGPALTIDKVSVVNNLKELSEFIHFCEGLTVAV